MGLLDRFKALTGRSNVTIKVASTIPLTKAMEVKLEVKVFEVDYLCPVCKNGYMRPIGGRDGRIQQHSCNNGACWHQMPVEDKIYPIRIVERFPVESN